MASPEIKRARQLRRRQTDAEAKLWRELRNRQFVDAKFRRQVPLGGYIVDFLCEEQALIVELDGGQHAADSNHDQERTQWLENEGYRVVRFWNNDVMENIEGVLEELRRFIGD